MIRRSIGAIAIACTACGGDIRLGNAIPDSAPDAPDSSGPFSSGAYVVSFLDPASVMCMGSLTGHEADFSTITRASSNFVDGSVDFVAMTAALVITGGPIEAGFLQSSITLIPDVAAAPNAWDTTVTSSLGSGPDATTADATGLAVDSSTANAPAGVEGEIVRVFIANDGGQCAVAFGALFVRS